MGEGDDSRSSTNTPSRDLSAYRTEIRHTRSIILASHHAPHTTHHHTNAFPYRHTVPQHHHQPRTSASGRTPGAKHRRTQRRTQTLFLSLSLSLSLACIFVVREKLYPIPALGLSSIFPPPSIAFIWERHFLGCWELLFSYLCVRPWVRAAFLRLWVGYSRRAMT